MLALRRPAAARIDAFLTAQGERELSYADVGGTRGPLPPGYWANRCRVRIGTGEAAFARACQTLRRWDQLRLIWLEPHPHPTTIAEGTLVAVAARCLGVWTVNCCRVVYTIDEHGPVERFGFGYGTLRGHQMRGEELFAVEWRRADDCVWYEVYSFSRPARWLARCALPLVRRLQRRFLRASADAMRASVSTDSRSTIVSGA
jgi:uncharacterized protein (UPF0548 family)